MMNKHYSKYKSANYDNRQYKPKENYQNRRKQYNKNYYYPMNNRRKRKLYEIYEEDISYNKENTISANTPSTKDNSLSQSSNNSDSIKQTHTEQNYETNDKFELLSVEDTTPKINLSESELKTAYYKPKKYSSNTSLNTSLEKYINNITDKNENTVILEINIKLSKDKSFNFKLRKYDDMFQVTKEACINNEISEEYINFFVLKIIKALNSIYGIYNLSLKEHEIKFLNDLKEKCI